MLVCCRDCKGFIPDKIGSGYGVGQCKYYTWECSRNMIREHILMELGQPRGIDVFWGGTEKRDCLHFKSLQDKY